MIPNAVWSLFSDILFEFSQDAGQEVVTLMSAVRALNLSGENGEPTTYTEIDIPCIRNYNFIRTWPITFTTETGELDRQTVQLFFHKDQLRNQGLLTSNGNLKYRPDFDRFRLDGFVYKSVGDTSASQAGPASVYFLVVLKKEELETASDDIA